MRPRIHLASCRGVNVCMYVHYLVCLYFLLCLYLFLCGYWLCVLFYGFLSYAGIVVCCYLFVYVPNYWVRPLSAGLDPVPPNFVLLFRALDIASVAVPGLRLRLSLCVSGDERVACLASLGVA